MQYLRKTTTRTNEQFLERRFIQRISTGGEAYAFVVSGLMSIFGDHKQIATKIVECKANGANVVQKEIVIFNNEGPRVEYVRIDSDGTHVPIQDLTYNSVSMPHLYRPMEWVSDSAALGVITSATSAIPDFEGTVR